MSTQGQTNRPRRATSRSGNVAPSVPQPRTSRTVHHFPAFDPSDSVYSERLVKHALPPYLGRRCAATSTISNRDFLFTGNFVSPAISSDWAEAGKVTLSAPFCVTFNDNESLRYSTAEVNKTVKLSHKIDLIADITAHDSIHDMLDLDFLTPFPQLKVAFNKTLQIVYSYEDKDPGVEFGELHATQKLAEAYKVYKDLHDAEAANHRRVNQRPRAAVPPSSSSLSGGQGQATAAGAPPVAAPGPVPQPLPHGPSQSPFAELYHCE